MKSEQTQHPGWHKLRQCWFNLASLDGIVTRPLDRDPNRPEPQELDRARVETKVVDHQEVLDGLVAAGQIEVSVAEHIQRAFAEAAFHVWRSQVMITCYRPTELGVEYMRNRGDFVRQSKLLIELARDDSIDQDTIAQAQAAISRDLAFFQAAATLQAQKQKQGGLNWEAQGELVEQAKSGKIKASPEVEAASRLVIELLQGS